MPDETPRPTQDRVLIVDFGSQVTQLIARRVREAGVYSEIVPYDKAEGALSAARPKAIILSGGPASVHETGTPQAAQALFTAGVPVLGICYGEQAMVAALGGQVEGGHSREFGRAELQIIDETPLFDGVFQEGERAQVWMSHGDRVTRLPPGFRAVGISTGAPFAAIADDSRRLYGLQFHPEADAALIRDWIDGARQRIDELAIDEAALLAEVAALGDGAGPRAEDLFDRIARHWLENRCRSATAHDR